MKRWFAAMLGSLLSLQGAIVHPSHAALYHPIPAPLPAMTQKGFYATAVPWRKDLSFAKRFHIVEFGGFEDIADANRSGFEKIVAYEWMAGFYTDEENDFVRYAKAHPHKLLSSKPTKEKDFFYDMCDEELVNKRVDYLARRVHELGIDGIFFDWANSKFLEEKTFAYLRKSFHHRHPKTTYTACLKEFLRKLKERNILIITNQAYRDPELLAYVDYDMCESYMSGVEEMHKRAKIDNLFTHIPYTYYQPLEEVFEYFAYFHKLQKRYGFKNMIYMNYLAPKLLTTPHGYTATKPVEGIYYNYVLAKLGGFAQYSEVPFDHALEQDPIYFYDLGEPVGAMQKVDDLYLRFFTKGFVLLAPHLHSERYIAVEAPKSLYDLKEHCRLEKVGKSITIHLAPVYDEITGRFEPIAKVFLYED